jgi:RNA polymerase sigma-70 factor, ECF subfamily
MSADRDNSDRSPPRADEFLRLFAANQPRIFGYILALIPNWHDAEEVLGNTTVVLWNSFGDFRPGTAFHAWACRVAFNQVLTFRKRKKRGPLLLSDHTIEALARETDELSGVLDDQLQALAHCVGKLTPRQREILNSCYQGKSSIGEAAQRMGRPAGTIYKSLSRIRRLLFECIQGQLATEGRG